VESLTVILLKEIIISSELRSGKTAGRHGRPFLLKKPGFL
jgi:hypothetical protein